MLIRPTNLLRIPVRWLGGWVGGCICSATKKVRKVDIRYALRTFQIFWYTFGTHLTQKVDIFITSDKIADTIRISVSIVVILSISRIPQYYWCNLSSRNFLFQN